ncbi:MAG: amidohydrolase family protein [Geminicoccaceae bacterium]
MATTRIQSRWVVGHADGGHRLLRDGEVVWRDDTVLFVGRGYEGPVDVEIDAGNAVTGPGFVDLNALADLDSTVLAFDNQPDHEKGRVWPEAYLRGGPREVYTADEQDFGRYYAMVQLLRNGITSAQPIASLLYRAWSETYDEMARMADLAGQLGIRLFVGPAYMSGLTFLRADGSFDRHFDEARGLTGLAEAVRFVRDHDGRHGGLVNGMLAPDRIETCTPELLRATVRARAELECPVRLHCCQSRYEFDTVRQLHGKTPVQWLQSLGFLGPKVMLPHGLFLTGTSYTDVPGTADQEILAGSGATLVTCPLVGARYASGMESFARYRRMGIRIGMGTDTYPPDMIMNMREAVHICRIAEKDDTALSAAEVYTAATIGGAEALGRSDLGRLAPGCKADLTVIRLDAVELGQVFDPIQALVLAGSGRDVDTVVVNGRIVMQDRQLPGIDLAALRDRAQAQYEKLISTYPERSPGNPPVEKIFAPSFPLL